MAIDITAQYEQAKRDLMGTALLAPAERRAIDRVFQYVEALQRAAQELSRQQSQGDDAAVRFLAVLVQQQADGQLRIPKAQVEALPATLNLGVDTEQADDYVVFLIPQPAAVQQ